MSQSILHQNIVLVLNRNWQAINTRTPAEAFCQMATDVATALDIQGKDWMVPTKWDDWQQLPVREGDASIGTASGRIRVPTVIVVSNFARVPMKRPKFNSRNLWVRDGGKCQYTGRDLKPGEGNIDHVVPRSRGGATTWDNCVLAACDVNSRKADRTPEEAGLKLQKVPSTPRELPVTALLRNIHGIPDWDPFLVQK
ncbi:MAG: HNH endonuclease [Verrucomicrobiales bacterium]|nr:HNH endonuclease [Verrucomicrobiales bacterium]